MKNKKICFVTSGANPDHTEAIKDALEKILPRKKIFLHIVNPLPHHRPFPLTIMETLDLFDKNIDAILDSYAKNPPKETYDAVYALSFAIGTTINDVPKPAVLICAAAMKKRGWAKYEHTLGDAVPLRHEMRKLAAEGNSVHKASELVYGGDFGYELLSTGSQKEWLSKAMVELLQPYF